MKAVEHIGVNTEWDHGVSSNGPPRAARSSRGALNARYSRADGNDVAIGHVQRPVWRGRVHFLALTVAVPAVLVLVVLAEGTTWRRIGVGVYALGLCSMLLVSVIYHRWVHGLRARSAWRRADHATIFAAIAGSATPITMWAMPGVAAVVLVSAIWSVAVIGAGCKLARWSRGDRAGTLLYAVAIALGAVAVPSLWARHGAGPAFLVVAGGIIYLFGAACFAKNWPTLRPSVFSFHEVWHVFTAVAAGLHFAAIWILAT
ncbi:hemolysin III family protein [soil metagenome]